MTRSDWAFFDHYISEEDRIFDIYEHSLIVKVISLGGLHLREHKVYIRLTSAELANELSVTKVTL